MKELQKDSLTLARVSLGQSLLLGLIDGHLEQGQVEIVQQVLGVGEATPGMCIRKKGAGDLEEAEEGLQPGTLQAGVRQGLKRSNDPSKASVQCPLEDVQRASCIVGRHLHMHAKPCNVAGRPS